MPAEHDVGAQQVVAAVHVPPVGTQSSSLSPHTPSVQLPVQQSAAVVHAPSVVMHWALQRNTPL